MPGHFTLALVPGDTVWCIVHHDDITYTLCPLCHGEGTVLVVTKTNTRLSRRCPDCNGHGRGPPSVVTRYKAVQARLVKVGCTVDSNNDTHIVYRVEATSSNRRLFNVRSEAPLNASRQVWAPSMSVEGSGYWRSEQDAAAVAARWTEEAWQETYAASREQQAPEACEACEGAPLRASILAVDALLQRAWYDAEGSERCEKSLWTRLFA